MAGYYDYGGGGSIAAASDYPGGGLSSYTGTSQPYAGVHSGGSGGGGYDSREAIGAILSGGGSGGMGPWARAAGFLGTGGVSEIVGGAVRKFFGKEKEKPKAPYWQRLANREWAQGNAALAAQAALYEPTLALTRRAASDYGDLYRKASNEALAFDINANRLQREADISDYMRLGPELLSARRTADPLFGQAYDLASQDLRDVNAPLPPDVERDLYEAVRQSQVQRGMGLGGSDAFNAALARTMKGEQFRSARRQQAFGEARSLLDIYGDPFQSLTGRTARSGPQGSTIQAPQVGTTGDDFLSYGINREIQSRDLAAARRAGNMQLLGSIIETGGKIGGMAAMCWVARAVYGEANPQWLLFREWLVEMAPMRFLRWYLTHGEAFARKLAKRPRTKAKLRRFMDARIAERQRAIRAKLAEWKRAGN